MQLTWLDSNSWLIEIAQKRILLDPWLVGSLVFGNLKWLFEGKKRTSRPLPENIDLILLSQGLEDHAHPPTLKELDRNIPVVGSKGAAKVCEGLGYSRVTALEHGEKFILGEQVEIKAVPGSPTGPNSLENGYIIRDLTASDSIYYEPHGFHSPTLKQETCVDVIITPLIDIKIPLLGPVIKGQKAALQACKWLNPQVILPTAAGGDIDFQGLLINFLKAEGSIADFRALLADNDLKTQVMEPEAGKAIAL